MTAPKSVQTAPEERLASPVAMAGILDAVRHDLAGPVQSILNVCFTARRRSGRGMTIPIEMLALVEREAERLRGRLSRLDELSLASRPPRVHRHPLGEFTDVAVVRAVPAELRLGVKLGLPSPADDGGGGPQIVADAEQTALAVAALIREAVALSEAGGEVGVDVQLDDDLLLVCVQAVGGCARSLSPDGPPHPSPHSPDAELWIEREIASAVAAGHGGTLVVSNAPGDRCCTTLKLPLSPGIAP